MTRAETITNPQVEGSIPFVSIPNLYSEITCGDTRNEEISSTWAACWAACRVALCFDIGLSFLPSLMAVHLDQFLAAPSERKILG